MPSMFAPFMSGLSWFGVLPSLRSLPFTYNQTQPEPNVDAGAAKASHSSFILSMLPNDLSMAADKAAEGAPPLPLGAIACQNMSWL